MSRMVVVTGGEGGIGRATAERFRTLGDDVRAPGRADLDVTSEASVAAYFQDTPVDVLVNNAGLGESAPLARTTLADWQRHLDVNATGAFLCTRAVITGMRERGRGAIVTVASTAGVEGAPYVSAYTAAKHAAVGLMRATAAELERTGVTANAVCPTFVDTPMTARTVDNIVARTGRTEEEARAALGPLLDPGEVAAAVVWLASAEAAGISGQTLVIDGGGIQT